MALSNEDVPEVVYENLLSTVKDALPTLHRYMEEKKKALKLEQMHMYDVYVPIVEGADLKFDYEQAYDLVVDGLGVLGKEYQDLQDSRLNRFRHPPSQRSICYRRRMPRNSYKAM